MDFGGFQDHAVNGGQDVLSLGYMELIAPLIKAVQELRETAVLSEFKHVTEMAEMKAALQELQRRTLGV